MDIRLFKNINKDKNLKQKSYLLIGFCLVLNLLAWGILFYISKFSYSLLSLGLLAYFFGLRHAFDADHIAVIDNVTRKLRQDNKKSVSVGLFFSLGHSSVVILLSLALVLALRNVSSHLEELKNFGQIIGTTSSAIFLSIIALVNFFILKKLFKLFKAHKNGKYKNTLEKKSEELLQKRGFFSRIFFFIYRNIDKSYKMYFVGFIFGLGFDTATEIAILGISTDLAQNSVLGIWSIMVFPLLFTAGMSLLDSIDGLVMLKIYDWAMQEQAKKLFFNITITATSVFIALSIAIIEWLQLISKYIKSDFWIFDFVNKLNFTILGVAIVFIMLFAWAFAFIYYKKVFNKKVYL